MIGSAGGEGGDGVAVECDGAVVVEGGDADVVGPGGVRGRDDKLASPVLCGDGLFDYMVATSASVPVGDVGTGVAMEDSNFFVVTSGDACAGEVARDGAFERVGLAGERKCDGDGLPRGVTIVGVAIQDDVDGAFYRNESQMNCVDCPYRDRCRKGGAK